MKKLLTLLLSILMIISLVGCNSNKEETPIEETEKQEEVVEPTQEEPEILGGYIDVEDGTITTELQELFDTALKGLLSANYEAKKLVASQLVAGTNYKFLAEGTKTTNPITIGTYYVYINKDLDGNISLLDIETIEEHQEEVKEKDYTGVKFWVVVYDQFDNEISRTTAVYGSTVKDPNGNDVLVDHNKYFHTTVNYGNQNSSPSHNCQYSTTYLVYCNSTGFESNIDIYELQANGYKKIANMPNLLISKYSGDLSAGRWSHTDTNPMTSGGIVFTYCEDNEAHTFEPPCALNSPIIYIIERSGAYAHWNFYEYDEGSSTYVINGAYSRASGEWPTLPWELAVGKYYHVSTEAEWSYWKSNDPTRASATYTECSAASVDHAFAS